MKYKTVIHYKDADGNAKQESVTLSALTERDAQLQTSINKEVAEIKYGKSNVIKVEIFSE
jgi:hypothetical protein